MTYDLFSQVCHREKNRMQIYIQTTCARQKTGFATQIFAITIFLIDDRMQKFPKLRVGYQVQNRSGSYYIV